MLHTEHTAPTKLLTVTVPCYNSADFMHKCVDSILEAALDLDVILVNDGSKDDTLAVCEDYAHRYPGTVRVVDQENGGWGEGINQGIARARGTFFIEVDSDDRVDPQALRKLYETLERFISEREGR